MVAAAPSVKRNNRESSGLDGQKINSLAGPGRSPPHGERLRDIPAGRDGQRCSTTAGTERLLFGDPYRY